MHFLRNRSKQSPPFTSRLFSSLNEFPLSPRKDEVQVLKIMGTYRNTLQGTTVHERYNTPDKVKRLQKYWNQQS